MEKKPNIITRLIHWTIKVWKGIWEVIKSMKNWRGVISLLISWILLSGVGLIAIGFIFGINKLKVIGLTMWIFWMGPGPLMLFVIIFAMILQRVVFRDKSVTFKSIKEKFKEGWDKEKVSKRSKDHRVDNDKNVQEHNEGSN